MRYAAFLLLFALAAGGQTTQSQPPVQVPSQSKQPIITKFVSPPYPTAARTNHIMGPVKSVLTIAADGSVKDVKIISAHPIFGKAVVKAGLAWRFEATGFEQTFDVTWQFELVTDLQGECQQVPPETNVVFEFPNVVHIRTPVRCIDVTVS